MSDRIQPDWQVLRSVESEDGHYCVDFFGRSDATFGFEEFRRDVEDAGRWTGIAYHSHTKYQSLEDALKSAVSTVSWLD